MVCSIAHDPIALDLGQSYRTRDEILQELVQTLSQVCDILKKRANIKDRSESIEFGITVRQIQRDTEYLRRCLDLTLDR